MKFFKEILFIFLLAFFFASLTSGVNQVLSPRIALNEQTRNTRYLLDVLEIEYPPGADSETLKEIETKRVQVARLDDRVVYREVDEDGKPSGYAFRIEGKGFWGRITGFLALDENLSAIKGIIFTSHMETPGLGARIDEGWFREQFKGIELREEKSEKNHVRITLAKSKDESSVDAISGATMTSNLLEKFLNEDIRTIVSQKDRIRRLTWQSPQEK